MTKILSFFQKIVAAQTSRSSITVLNDAAGNKLTSFSQISGEAVNFFQNLLGVGNANVTGCSTELLAELLQVKHPLRLQLICVKQ